MKILLSPGEKLTVGFSETDGELEIEWGTDSLTVKTEWADSTGRVGTIYEEKFGPPIGDVDLLEKKDD